MTTYQEAKKQYSNDKPLIRMSINDSAHNIAKELKLPEYNTTLLHNYACKLHPKE
jgi:hypothetical protein